MIRDGRLGKGYDEEVAVYTSSLKFDKRLFEHDILGSMAHAVMLHEKGIINEKVASSILSGLEELLEAGFESLNRDPRIEDVHMAIEEYLSERVGEDAGMLHIGRSRNDQVACDLRMWVRDAISETMINALKLCQELAGWAAKNITTIFPGYTHLQRAQPTTLGHHLLAHCDSLLRDVDRLDGAYERTNLSPLGAGALATSSFDIDRELTSNFLGFNALLENSMDAVSARDFILETIASLSIMMVEVSRLIEELILWSTAEFGFIELPDEYSSTSSIMPQKKNPDVLEIMRARVGRVSGNLASVLAIQKSLPLTYNRDLQELSPLLEDSLFIANNSLAILRKILSSIKVNSARAAEVCEESFITATDVAELLVREEGMPFRKAHRIVGRAVQLAHKNKLDRGLLEKAAREIDGSKITLKEKDIKAILSASRAVESRKVTGGHSSLEVKRMIRAREKILDEEIKRVDGRLKNIKKAKKHLCGKVDSLLEV
ncbi:MAG: argininosuccinate lyase [Candidatus Hydrothermarchaeota archaeon]|nr:argininosuccinate lyase [Candidatus Hydrothermarchaeota archaeon]